jgi:hypothetical protein
MTGFKKKIIETHIFTENQVFRNVLIELKII